MFTKFIIKLSSKRTLKKKARVLDYKNRLKTRTDWNTAPIYISLSLICNLKTIPITVNYYVNEFRPNRWWIEKHLLGIENSFMKRKKNTIIASIDHICFRYCLKESLYVK